MLTEILFSQEYVPSAIVSLGQEGLIVKGSKPQDVLSKNFNIIYTQLFRVDTNMRCILVLERGSLSLGFCRIVRK